jgi:Arc/MetJ-type ribon-helix-helix transcriptional regulator
MQWVQLLTRDFEKVTVISPAKSKNHQDWGSVSLPPGVSFFPMPLNRWDQMEELRRLAPELVMFDRFILEEQYGPLAYEALPDALFLLETQDLHFIRRDREAGRETGWQAGWQQNEAASSAGPLSDTALRELAAIERVDHAFVVSSFEEWTLRERFGLGAEVHSWEPFFYEPAVMSQTDSTLDFEERFGFVWIGNFRHAPNADALRWIRREIWPAIRRALPTAEFRIHGAYPSQEFMQWNHSGHDGIRVVGPVADLSQVFSKARVNLAPLRFGAGVKGKILEGFRHGVPAVTTWVGAEGLLPVRTHSGESEADFPGSIGRSVDELVREAVRLHEDVRGWRDARARAHQIMNEFYDLKKREAGIRKRIENWLQERRSGALPRWRSRVMRHSLQNGQRYFSKWIEEKERSSNRGSEGPS